MTRKEEIREAAWVYYQDLDTYNFLQKKHCNNHTEAFEAGAKWADKTTLEKVLNFIYENFYDHPHASGHICTDSFQSLENLEEELIKTIEL